MAERTTLTQKVQIGVESTPGTVVPANKNLQSLDFEADIQGTADVFRPAGYKYPTITAQGKEWTVAKVKGQATYSEIVYPLSSILTTATTAAAGGTGTKWTFAPSSTAEDTPKTFTVEQGSSLRAHRFAHAIFDDLELGGDRDKLSFGGSLLARAVTDGVTMTASPTDVELLPMLPKEFDVYVDTTSGGLGGTKLTRLLKWKFSVKNRYSPLWTVNSAETSWVTVVEKEPMVEVELLVEADAQGMGLLTAFRDSSTRFIRITGTSASLAGTATPYKLQLDLAVKASKAPGKFEDEDGVYAIKYTFRAHHDATWGKAIAAEVTNKVSAL